MKKVFLLPGFMSTQLALASNSVRVWWDIDGLVFNGTGVLRLAGNGIDPGPPDGRQMGITREEHGPWAFVAARLKQQLDQQEWQIGYTPWDWRKDPRPLARSLAQNIRDVSTPAEPATLVAHSAGGILAVLTWAELVNSGDSALVRRLITMGTPFQGSYSTIDFLAGTSPAAAQAFEVGQLGTAVIQGTWRTFQGPFLNGVALSWPNFYYLFPALGGSEAAKDPNRPLLYGVNNYPNNIQPNPFWQNDAKDNFQPQLRAANTFPPENVATYVAGDALPTWSTLRSGDVPIDLNARGYTFSGDGVVTRGSALREPGAQYIVPCAHNSLPEGIAQTGLMAKLILDERPPTPVPPTLVHEAVQMTTTDAPQEEQVNPFVCIGGHC